MEVCDYDNRAAGLGRHGNWMQTYSGRQFWPLDPKPEEVYIEDIAHGLSNACRYSGQTLRFYSVAEHSVHVSYCVPPDMALVGLMHDATEAYVTDIIRPIKPYLTNYAEIEHGVWVAIVARFGLPVELPPEIKKADTAVLLAEQQQIMAPPPADWCIPGEPANVKIEGWYPVVGEERFLARFRELYDAAA